MSAAAGRLAELLKTAPARLVEISDAEAANRPSGKWSKKEILGHLIDSVANNHQRIVRAQLVAHLDFPRYEQDTWVAAQGYREEPWPDLVNLWLLYNRHLLHIMSGVPAECLSHTISIGGTMPITLGFLMEDYLRHLEHHLEQIWG
ncbi:MAG TPA: DinB family protein [Candidatus Sulfopaludibacter sp.]|nr:DinB family protein [Candidatus Sulfopaludibacter sp.]